MIKKAALILLVVSSITFLTYLIIPPQLPPSPLGDPTQLVQGTTTSSYLVLGFAPYWNLKKITPTAYQGITHLAYFALHLQGNGELYTHVNTREEDPGYTNYKRLLSTPPDSPLILTYMQQNQAALTALLNSPSAQTTAIKTIKETLSQIRGVGINIDFEPTVDITSQDRANFTTFIANLHAALPQDTLLTISHYPSAAAKPRLWDLQALEPFTDYFVMMTYDYTLPSSSRVGPNAPLRDNSNVFEHTILKNLRETTTLIPASKILLGIPFYGYEWETSDPTKYAPALSRGTTASLERIESLRQSPNLTSYWDHNTLTPYALSTDSGTLSQIYYDNETSLSLKLELVKSAGLGGIAIWALGYEQNVPWLWPLINTLP